MQKKKNNLLNDQLIKSKSFVEVPSNWAHLHSVCYLSIRPTRPSLQLSRVSLSRVVFRARSLPAPLSDGEKREAYLNRRIWN